MLWKEATQQFEKVGLQAAIVNRPIKKRVRALERGTKKDDRITTNTFVVTVPRYNNIVVYRKNVKTELEQFYNSEANPVILKGIAERLASLNRKAK